MATECPGKRPSIASVNDVKLPKHTKTNTCFQQIVATAERISPCKRFVVGLPSLLSQCKCSASWWFATRVASTLSSRFHRRSACASMARWLNLLLRFPQPPSRSRLQGPNLWKMAGSVARTVALSPAKAKAPCRSTAAHTHTPLKPLRPRCSNTSALLAMARAGAGSLCGWTQVSHVKTHPP